MSPPLEIGLACDSPVQSHVMEMKQHYFQGAFLSRGASHLTGGIITGPMEAPAALEPADHEEAHGHP